METKLIGPLTLVGFEVDIYGFGMELGSSDLLDGVAVDQSSINLVPYSAYESMHQADVDRIIDARCANTRACSIFLRVNQTLCQEAIHEREETLCRHARHEREVSSRNALRQLYSERRVGIFLQARVGREYAAAIVASPDYHLAFAIDELQLLSASLMRDTVYTTEVNPGGRGGTTNGFYFGAPLALSRILRRYEYLEDIEAYLLRTGKQRSLTYDLSYEQVLGHAFTWANVTQASTPLVFFKIRADGMPDWQGPHTINHLTAFQQQRVLEQWDFLVADLCAWERLDRVPDLPRFQSMKTHFICACNGVARFGVPGYWSPWQPHRMVSSRRQEYMHCDVHTFQKPQGAYPYAANKFEWDANFWWSAQKWYASNRTRRQCQCKLNISEHVDANGPYALPAAVTKGLVPNAVTIREGWYMKHGWE